MIIMLMILLLQPDCAGTEALADHQVCQPRKTLHSSAVFHSSHSAGRQIHAEKGEGFMLILKQKPGFYIYFYGNHQMASVFFHGPLQYHDAPSYEM